MQLLYFHGVVASRVIQGKPGGDCFNHIRNHIWGHFVFGVDDGANFRPTIPQIIIIASSFKIISCKSRFYLSVCVGITERRTVSTIRYEVKVRG